MTYFHLTVRARYGLRPFTDRELCAALWARLRRRFPSVLACILMPNHVHLDLEGRAPEEAKRAFARELNAFSMSSLPGIRVWDPIPPPEILPNPLHVMRHIRYVHLNPCRAGFAKDPLEWEWSTHRDALHAVTDPWIDLKTAYQLWEGRACTFSERFHAYVSGDPTVHVAGTPLPKLSLGSPIVSSLDRIREAVLQVTRAPTRAWSTQRAPQRRLALLAAKNLGSAKQEDLAQWLQVTARTVRNLLSETESPQELRTLKKIQWSLLHRDRLFPKAEK